MNRSIVGMNIKQARKKKHMTQKELAKRIGYTESSISKYEQGLVDIPNAVIGLIARELEVQPVDLLGEAWDQEYNPEGKLADESALIDKYGADAAKLLELFSELNELGKKNALEHLEDLTNLPKYSK